MAREPLTVSVRVFIRECQPDGRPCYACDDVPYLEAAELYVSISGGEPTPAAYLCKDCGEDARERFAD